MKIVHSPEKHKICYFTLFGAMFFADNIFTGASLYYREEIYVSSLDKV